MFLAQFDTMTLALISAVAFALQSMMLFTFYMLANEYQGIGLSAVGHFFYGSGFGLVIFRGLFADTSLVSGAIILTLFGATLLAGGIARFCDRRSPLRWMLPVIFAAGAISLYFERAGELNLRMMIVSLGLALVFLYAGAGLLFVRQPSYRIAAILTSVPFLVYAFFLVVRMVSLLYSTEEQSLLDSTPAQILFFLLFFVCSSLWTGGFILMIAQRLRNDLHSQARVDFLTRLPNRLAMQELFDAHVSQAQRDGTHFSVLLVDVDHFKAINDRFGHAAGDQALQGVANRLAQRLRPGDWLGRWGGEEFLILLPAARMDSAGDIGERLRQAVAAEALPLPGGSAQVSVSIGVACWPAHGATVDDLLRAADAALYTAKQSGRNRVVTAPTGV